MSPPLAAIEGTTCPPDCALGRTSHDHGLAVDIATTTVDATELASSG